MSATPANKGGRKVAVVIGATSKWQSDGQNTAWAHGGTLDDTQVPVGARWGVGGAIAQKFAKEGFFTVVTTRNAHNAERLLEAMQQQGGAGMIVELDLSSDQSIVDCFRTVRTQAGEPEIVIYNAGYMDGRELPPEMELLENMPTEIFDKAHHIASRGPFLVAKEVLPAMRKRGSGSLFFSNNPYAFRGKKRHTGESLYYPRVMSRHLAQVLTEEYSEFGIHIATVMIDGLIDSPGTRALKYAQEKPDMVMDPTKLAEGYYYLHMQDRSCWTHELQMTPFPQKPNY